MSEFRQTARPEGPPGGAPPPEWDELGWGADGHAPPPGGARVPDLSAVFAVIEALRAMVPAELQSQFSALVRELLLTLRAAIDWYLERLDGGPRPPRVEDIPID
jgi:hypothetical protein